MNRSFFGKSRLRRRLDDHEESERCMLVELREYRVCDRDTFVDNLAEYGITDTLGIDCLRYAVEADLRHFSWHQIGIDEPGPGIHTYTGTQLYDHARAFLSWFNPEYSKQAWSHKSHMQFNAALRRVLGAIDPDRASIDGTTGTIHDKRGETP